MTLEAIQINGDLMKLSQLDGVIMPVQPVTLKAMMQDTVIKRQHVGVPKRVGGGKRSKITRLTRPALRRMKLHFRNMPEASHMITLTYPRKYTNDGLKVKRHFKAIKTWLIRHGVTSGAWFLEFQKRGAPHFHIFVNAGVLPEELARAWIRIVFPAVQAIAHNEASDLLQTALNWHIGGILKGRRKDGSIGVNRPCIEPIRVKHCLSSYATSYAAKAEQKRVPRDYQNVGRFWGVWGDWRNVEAETHGGRLRSDVSEWEEVEQWAAIRVVRSIRGLLKSRGYRVRDKGVYGFVAWGVGESLVSSLMSWYRDQRGF